MGVLQRCTAASGVVYYVSPLLESAGAPHAFSTRLGGVSPPPFDLLNLGRSAVAEVPDTDENIRENYRRLHEAIGCVERPRCRVHQVHGAEVCRVRAGKPFDTSQKADALLSDDPARVVAVRVADCVPVLLASEDGRVVAAVHAGWRGIVAGVVPAAAMAMVRVRCPALRTPGWHGHRPGTWPSQRDGFREERPGQSLLAAIGPCISARVYEVGEEVVAEFWRAMGSEAPIHRREDGRATIDLREAVRRQLMAAGVPADRIDISDRCTYHDREEFFSYRRDGGNTGQMAAIIGAAKRET